MITVICLWWIGISLMAPHWYYAILVIRVILHFFVSLRDAKTNKRIREHMQRSVSKKRNKEGE